METLVDLAKRTFYVFFGGALLVALKELLAKRKRKHHLAVVSHKKDIENARDDEKQKYEKLELQRKVKWLETETLELRASHLRMLRAFVELHKNHERWSLDSMRKTLFLAAKQAEDEGREFTIQDLKHMVSYERDKVWEKSNKPRTTPAVLEEILTHEDE